MRGILGSVVIWRHRFVGLLAVVALLGTPVVEIACAILCTPTQGVAQPAATNASHHDAGSRAHHRETAPSPQADTSVPLDVTRLSAPACDTHGRPEGELQATLTPSRGDTMRDVALAPAPAPGHESFASAGVPHTTLGYSPPPNLSATPGPLVLRI
jgi:hypothetical protein